MTCNKTNAKNVKKLTANEKYLNALFNMLKKRESIGVTGKKMKFNDTELRLIGEILSAKYNGERLISTQLATLLGITRSAVSQIVNRLETQGVVKRVADDVDRKIAYIEVTDETLTQYQKELKICAEFAGKVVKKYGEEKFETLCALVDEFINLVEEEKREMRAKK